MSWIESREDTEGFWKGIKPSDNGYPPTYMTEEFLSKMDTDFDRANLRVLKARKGSVVTVTIRRQGIILRRWSLWRFVKIRLQILMVVWT